MATITERLQALGIGVKGDIQKQREASPGMNQFGTRSGPEYADIKAQEEINRDAGVTLKRFDGRLRSGEKLRNIGGVTYVVPADPPAAPINTTGFDLSADIRTPDNSIPPMSADGMGGYSQGGMFSPPPPPTRPDMTPTRPTAVDPTRETQFGNMQQEVIPVSPDDAIQTLMARLTNYYKDDTPAMPVRRQDVAPIPQAFTPRPEPMQGPGLMTPQLPQPNVPNLDVQAYAPDMFRGQLPMPEPTQYDSDPLGIENIPIQANPLAELPLGTVIDEQGNLINVQTGAIITPNYQPNY